MATRPVRVQWSTLPDVLTISQAAAILQMSIENVRRGCVNNTIPAAKLGGAWRISKRRLMALMGEEATT